MQIKKENKTKSSRKQNPYRKKKNGENRIKKEKTTKTNSNTNSEEEETWTCSVCKNSTLLTKEQMKEHYKSEHPQKKLLLRRRVRCEICNEEYRESYNYHLYCKECDCTYKTVIDYVIHEINHKTNSDGQFKCFYCKLTTKNMKEIKNHLDTNHKNTHKYHCGVCTKGFQSLLFFEEHKNVHTGEKPFSCEFCGKSFVRSRYLKRHQDTIHNEEITGETMLHQCGICERQFPRRDSLRLHRIRTHLSSIVCEVCGRVLSSKEKLKFHMRTHTGDKPFSCTYCSKCFTKKTTLVEHIRVHTGERPYICEYCHKGFSQRTSLVIHTRTHTGERPFVCHICNKGFTARAILNMHLKNCKGFSS